MPFGVPPSWPFKGSIRADSLVVRYRPHLPPVLKGITLSIHGREKVGVCGRRGCGKSTLVMALFRIVEPLEGAVFIYGINRLMLGLADLRSRLSLVPQDPVIFSGSIRSNLDPFGQVEQDQQLWGALSQAGVEDMVRAMGVSGRLRV